MNISKALVLAVQNWDQYGRFYDAIKEDQDLAKPGLTEEEIEKSKLLVGFVNERLRDMLVTPLRTLRDTLKP
ncbi:MAG: hypothetical protein HY897_14745, partial [Deltaproteobacteria bacterium]|nr:hypothetical protein [Deltaproteobacteria bacterium]